MLHLQSGCRIACRIAEVAGYSTVRRWATFASPRFWQRARELRAFERWQIQHHAGLLVAPSRRVIRDFDRWHGLPATRFTVVPNATDLAPFPRPAPRLQQPAPTGPLRLLFVANNPWLKGLDLVIDALRNWRPEDRPFHLTIVGVENWEPWQVRIQRLGLSSHITWLGPLPDVRSCYTHADVLVHPSRRDAGSLVLWEAWAAGLPVIGSPDDGSAEHIREGINGWLLAASGSAGTLRECLQRVAADPNLGSMANACRATAEAYTLQHQFNRLRTLLELPS
jgi:glycosyltransferase involved in cell wall biosynthesis